MITADDKVGPPTGLSLQRRGECLCQIVGSIVGSFEVDERPDQRLTSDRTSRAVVSRVEVIRRNRRAGHVMPTDPHYPQISNLEISANSNTFGKQATPQHDRHRKQTNSASPRVTSWNKAQLNGWVAINRLIILCSTRAARRAAVG